MGSRYRPLEWLIQLTSIFFRVPPNLSVKLPRDSNDEDSKDKDSKDKDNKDKDSNDKDSKGNGAIPPIRNLCSLVSRKGRFLHAAFSKGWFLHASFSKGRFLHAAFSGHRGVAPRVVEDREYDSIGDGYHAIFMRRIHDLMES